MQKLFEKNTPAQVAIILATLALLWSGALAHPEPMAPADGYAPLYQLLYNLHPAPWLAVLTAMVLVVTAGFLLNLMLAHTGMVPQNSLLPTLLYIVFMSAFCHSLTPLLFVSLASVACVKLLLLRSTPLSLSLDKICGVAALVAVSSLFYLPSLALVAAYLLVAINYRLYGWREWAALLLGMLAPYLLLWCWFFLAGGLHASLQQTASGLGAMGFSAGEFSTLEAVANAVLAATLLSSLLFLWSRLGESTVVWQKNAVTLTAPALSGLIMLLYSQVFPVDTQLFAVPFAFCGTCMLLAPLRTRYGKKHDWRPWVRASVLILTIATAALC